MWYAQPHSKDLLKEFCPWRRVYVRFERSPGDQPLLQLNTSNTTGEELLTTVQEVSMGGCGLLNWFSCLMLRITGCAHRLHVRVNLYMYFNNCLLIIICYIIATECDWWVTTLAHTRTHVADS